jgi:hypothetical protein
VFDFKNFIPDEYYKKYFDAISTNSNVYICVIQDESQSSAVYLERPADKVKDVEGIIRVFYTQSDLLRYNKSVSVRENISLDFVKKWELPFDLFIDHLSKLDVKYKNAGKKGIMAVASAVYDERFVHVDTVWTKDRNVMV